MGRKRVQCTVLMGGIKASFLKIHYFHVLTSPLKRKLYADSENGFKKLHTISEGGKLFRLNFCGKPHYNFFKSTDPSHVVTVSANSYNVCDFLPPIGTILNRKKYPIRYHKLCARYRPWYQRDATNPSASFGPYAFRALVWLRAAGPRRQTCRTTSAARGSEWRGRRPGGSEVSHTC